MNPGGDNLKVLNEAPRDFRRPFNPTLTRTDAPRMEGHMIRAGETIRTGPGDGHDRSGARGPKDATAHPGGDKGGTGNPNTLRSGLEQKGDHATTGSVPIVFDHHSQSFMAEHQVVHGGNMRVVTEPVGTFLERSGGSFGGQQGAAAGLRGPGFNPTSGGSPGFRGGGVLNGGNDPRGNGGGGGFNGAGIGDGPRGGGGFNPGGGNSGGGNSGGGGSMGGGSPQPVGGGGNGGSFGGGGFSPHGGGSAPAPAPSPK